MWTHSPKYIREGAGRDTKERFRLGPDELTMLDVGETITLEVDTEDIHEG